MCEELSSQDTSEDLSKNHPNRRWRRKTQLRAEQRGKEDSRELK
jgi:hypothetical protein